jgi:PAS domain S-box-containing protein
MTGVSDFHDRYAAALRTYLAGPSEAALLVGHELGRQALQDQISILEIIENHFRLVEESTANGTAALQFLLQALAALDVATRGFIDGTRRYEQQRARAQDLADRDEFRSALVNSLQEGFFVADRDGAVIEINDAFADITGYGPENLPYTWPHPWMADDAGAADRMSRLLAEGVLIAEAQIRHRDGHTVWVAMSVNAVTSDSAQHDTYVGTIRDVTAARAAAMRESVVVRLATAVSVARSVTEVVSITFDKCEKALDLGRVLAVVWPAGDGEPTIEVAGGPSDETWEKLDPFLRMTLEGARHRLPLAVEPVWCDDDPETSRGFVAVLPGTGDVTMWLEHRAPHRITADDRQMVTVLVGHLSLAMQHVRQFEIARDTSLTLQRAMLAPMEPPAGFAVRYEPAVPPLEIGGDWYDVLAIHDNRIGIIVGDCVGRGLAAAAVMGQLRSSARALLLTGAEPATLLEQLDASAALIPDAFCTTVFVAIIDTKSATLQYSNAGHPPAMLATPTAEPRLLDGGLSVPLAVHRDEPRSQAFEDLVPGSTLMLYTDGLVERRDEPIDDGIEHVCEILSATSSLPVNEVADIILRELSPPEGYDDDVAIVVCRPSPTPLRIEKPATAEILAEVRDELGAWLRAAATPPAITADVVLAVNEACTNSIEHAYAAGAEGSITVEAEIGGNDLHVRVIDSGLWKTPPTDPGTRGRGLPLIKALSDRGVLDGTPAGTIIGMSFRLPVTRTGND